MHPAGQLPAWSVAQETKTTYIHQKNVDNVHNNKCSSSPYQLAAIGRIMAEASAHAHCHQNAPACCHQNAPACHHLEHPHSHHNRLLVKIVVFRICAHCCQRDHGSVRVCACCCCSSSSC
jgi:hypothetical protein